MAYRKRTRGMPRICSVCGWVLTDEKVQCQQCNYQHFVDTQAKLMRGSRRAMVASAISTVVSATALTLFLCVKCGVL